jgi:hypothetical protein
MLEIEAMNKECPFTKQPVAAQNSYTFDPQSPSFISQHDIVSMPYLCTGSRCMAWITTDIKLDGQKEGYCRLIEKEEF